MALVLSGSIDISGSMTATTIIVSAPGVAGMVSSSAQITELAPLMAYTASLKGAAIVSSSQQVQNYFTFAKTGSVNTFYANQNINGELNASIVRSNSHYIVSDGSAAAVVLQGYINNSLRIAESGSASSGGSRGMLYVGAIDVGGTTAFAENLVMASGKGIDFSATANSSGTMTSELLNDYEEGTWTPTISDGTNNATMTATYNRGQYIKVGRQVTVTGYVLTDSLGSVSGDIRITGLPYTNGSGYGYISAMVAGAGAALNITAGYNITGVVSTGQAYIGLNIWDSAGGTTALQASEFSSDGQLQIACTYLTDY